MGVSTQSTWGPVLGRLLSTTKMRAFAFVLLCVAAVKAEAEAEAEAYTIGQVAAGLTNGGVVTGVDYSNGVVSGLGAIGNRAYAGHVGYAGVGHLGYSGVGHLGYANHVVAATGAYGYSGVVASPAVHRYSALGYGYAGHYGKREAEAEADSDADAYTIAQVAAGLPVHNAIATGHAHNVGVVTGTTYAAPAYAGYRSYAAPAYTGYSGVGHVGHVGYAGLGYYGLAGLGYSGHAGLGYGYAGHYGKREAEADADSYTIGQVRAGLPLHNAYTAGHAYNAGVVSGYRSYAAPAYTGYAGVGHAGYAGHLGYASLGYSGLGYTGAYYG